MRGVYEATIKISSLAAAKTLMHLTAPATAAVEILSASITNCSSETNEQLEATFQRISALGTPTDTDITPVPKEVGDAAADTTVAGNVTGSEPTYASGTEMGREGFSSLGGYRFQPVPEERIVIPPSGSIGLRMLSTPTAFDALVAVTMREIG